MNPGESRPIRESRRAYYTGKVSNDLVNAFSHDDSSDYRFSDYYYNVEITEYNV